MRRRTALLIGFVLQAAALALRYALPHPNPYAPTPWVAHALAPGVTLFWAEGIHSSFPRLGFVAALVFDTLLFGAVLYALARWLTAPDERSELTPR